MKLLPGYPGLLQIMEKGGIIESRREGKFTIYHLSRSVWIMEFENSNNYYHSDYEIIKELGVFDGACC